MGGRLPTMNNNTNANVQQQLMNNQMASQQQQQQQQQGLAHNKNNLNLNLIHNQGMQQSLMSSTNASNNLNNMIMNNTGMSSSNDQNLNPSPQPQIQHQLIESFRLAVSSGLISADLLNTKLPQEVLTLLYQLFQTLTNYISANNKINELTKRRGQMLATQFKSDSDLLNLEAQNYKNNLIALQTKINGAHQILKQAGNQANTSGQKQSGSPMTPGLVSTPPANLDGSNRSVERAAAAAGVQLTDLPILKDHSNQMSNLNAQQQRSKLLQLLNETNDPLGQSKGMQQHQAGLSRQSSYQPNSNTSSSQQNMKLQQQFSQPGNFLSNSMNNQWGNFDSNALMAMGGNNGQVDDRITPFIPGQLWAGSQSSFEDDPNCTPGSVSKPLLTETIDPENILNGLQRGSQWSNFSDNILNNSMGMSSMLGNNNSSSGIQRSGNGIRNNNANSQNWPSGQSNFNSAQQGMNNNQMNSGSIGEQLWGVGSRSTSRAGNATNMNQLNSGINSNRNGNFNSNNQNQMMNQQQQQQHQQQFFRNNNNNNSSNWNQQTQSNESRQPAANNNSNNSNNNNNNTNNFNSMPINSGNYILIRNVTANVDQSTLRALCSQHATGQLTYYRYIQQMTCVVVRYNTREEANNAQNKLNSVSLGNTVIFTQPLNENDLK